MAPIAPQREGILESYLVSDEFSYERRMDTSLPASSYSFVAYFAYLFYVPLYLTGPIITFNAFRSQIDTPQRTHSKKTVAIYCIRVVREENVP